MSKHMGSHWKIVSHIIIAAALVGCAPGIPLEKKQNERPNEAVMPEGYSLFSLGRSLSDGAVDLFDPYLSFFEKTPEPLEQYETDLFIEEEIFPLSLIYRPADSDVTLFALPLSGDNLGVVSPDPVADPVPLDSQFEENEDVTR